MEVVAYVKISSRLGPKNIQPAARPAGIRLMRSYEDSYHALALYADNFQRDILTAVCLLRFI